MFVLLLLMLFMALAGMVGGMCSLLPYGTGSLCHGAVMCFFWCFFFFFLFFSLPSYDFLSIFLF